MTNIMEQKDLQRITRRWDYFTNKVVSLEEISTTEIQKLLLETYEVLYLFCKEDPIPKEIASIILAMDGYLTYASIMEEKEVPMNFYHFFEIYRIAASLKKGFFKFKYEAEFPKLKMSSLDSSDEYNIIDLKNDQLFI